MFIVHLTLCDTWGFQCLMDPFDKRLNYSQLHFLLLLNVGRAIFISQKDCENCITLSLLRQDRGWYPVFVAVGSASVVNVGVLIPCAVCFTYEG